MYDRENGNIIIKIFKKGIYLGKIIRLFLVYICWIQSDDGILKRNVEFGIIYIEILIKVQYQVKVFKEE